MQKTIFWICLVGLFLQWDNVGAFHDDVYQPRVPIELIEELQDIDNPYPATLERIELGKQIFYGKEGFRNLPIIAKRALNLEK